MNTADNLSFPESRPRLGCRIARFTCALRDGRSSRHVASCPACQAYFRSAETLEHALRHDARRAAEEVVVRPTLETDILRAVRTSATTPDTTQREPRHGLWIASCLATAAAVAVGVFTLQRSSNQGAKDASQEGAKAIVNVVETLSTRLVDTVIPSAGELVGENPLQRELGFVYADMRSAIDFIALNFSPVTSSVPSEPRRI